MPNNLSQQLKLHKRLLAELIAIAEKTKTNLEKISETLKTIKK